MMKEDRLLQRFLFGFALVFLSARAVLPQDTQVVQTNEKMTIKSRILNEERSILIRLPSSYATTSEKYPVVYMLDGQTPRVTLMTGIIENLVDGDFAPEMILVSIPNTIRPRDMTPSFVAGAPGSGGADNFLTFIETELLPEVEKKYRVQPYKILVGHSLSGLFVSYAFCSRPELFNAYLAASPFLQWDKNIVLKRGEELLKPKKELNRTLFFTLGDEPEYLDAFNGYREMLGRLRIKNLQYEVRQIPGENHWSTNVDLFNKGLRKVWADWKIPQPPATAEFSLADLEKHYQSASAKYGYEIPIQERQLTLLGNRLMQTGKMDEAIKVFERNTTLYPNSAYAYDSLAQAFEKKGLPRQAKDNFEKALDLAEKSNNRRLADRTRENITRVTAKLGRTNP